MQTITEDCRQTHSAQDLRPQKQPPYHVVMLDDDDHTYDYVIEMLQFLFGLSQEDAYSKAVEVDTAKQTMRVNVLGVEREHGLRLAHGVAHSTHADIKLSQFGA